MGRRKNKKKRRSRKGADQHGFAKGDRVEHRHSNVNARYEGEILDIGKGGYLVRFDSKIPGAKSDTMWIQRQHLNILQTREEKRRDASSIGTSLGEAIEKAKKPKPPKPQPAPPPKKEEPKPQVVSIEEARRNKHERDMAEWAALMSEAQKKVDEARARHGMTSTAAKRTEQEYLELLEQHRIATEKMQAEAEQKRKALERTKAATERNKKELDKALESLAEAEAMKPKPPKAEPEKPREPTPPPPPPPTGSNAVTERLFLPDKPHQAIANSHHQATLAVLRFVIDNPDGDYNANSLRDHFGNDYDAGMSSALSHLSRAGIITKAGEVKKSDRRPGRTRLSNYRLSPFVTPDLFRSLRPLTAKEMA